MVRAILGGSKTQTRRVVKGDATAERMDSFFTTFGANGYMFFGPEHEATFPSREAFRAWAKKTYPEVQWTICPFGKPGDRLWVRETFDPILPQDPNYNGGRPIEYDYAATYTHGDRLGDKLGIKKRWKPSIHMPRDASRITLEITGVRVERLNDISEADAIAEGIVSAGDGNGFQLADTSHYMGTARDSYASLWEHINGAGSYDKNPFVWVIEFKRIEGAKACLS